MMRPQPATWFEVIAAREDLLLALEALARTAAVELESPLRDATRAESAADAALTARQLREFAQLAARLRPYWPTFELAPDTERRRVTPAAALARALETLRRWAAEADPLVAQLQHCDAERASLALWRAALERLGPRELDLRALASVGPSMEAALFVLHGGEGVSLPPLLLAREASLDGERAIVAVGTGDAMAALAEQAAAQQGRKLDVPPGLGTDRDANLAALAGRAAACERKAGALSDQLAALDARHGLAAALADVARAAWFFEEAGALDGGAILSRMTGWTSDPPRIAAALAACGARAMVHFPAPPPTAQPPLLLRNPRWVQPFELFGRLLGMPGRAGADPSALLAVVAPLLFGYMFGDVGQGVVLLAAGLALSRRMPVLRLLVPGGIAAIAFGAAFGSLFGVDGLTALWVRPLDAPLPVLIVPLVGGTLLLGLGLLIGALQAWWAREFRRWLLAEAGLVLVYLGVMLAFVHAGAAFLALVGAVWQVVGNAWLEQGIPRHRLAVGLLALPRLAEKMVQILINTLSFVRVGAFALAHAGLSAAVVALGKGTGSEWGYAAALVAGNVLVIALETLVVSIQTTRLVLFEFFIRFFAATGRAFRPLAPPSVSVGESLHERTT